MNRALRAPAPLLGIFVLFAGSIAFSLAGMTALALAPSIGARVGTILPQLMAWPTWIYSATLPLAVFLALRSTLGTARSLVFAAWGTLVGGAAELIGTATGFPFGPYSYSDFLGAKILGRVPYAIPASWYAAALLSFCLASALGLVRTRRVVVAAVFMVLWDVALDPAMSAGFPIWEWHVAGIYYGMPLVNFAGWFLTGLIIMAGYELLQRGRRLDGGPWPIIIWCVNGVFALGICIKAGLWLALGVGLVAIGTPALLAWRARRAVA